MNPWTVQTVLDWTTDYFNKSDISSARLEAELLLAHVLQCKRLDLNIQKDDVIPEKKLGVYRNYIKTRKTRKPLSYILGRHEFMGLEFTVNEKALIPRPETEILVEETVALMKPLKNAIILDVCTGSGCIAVSIAKMADVKTAYATDISLEALSVCWQNVTAHCLAGKILIKQGDLFEAVKNEGITNRIDIIVSNPPYVAHDEFGSLLPELSYEPRIALDGGKEGLDFYRRLAKEARPYLKPGGYMAVELNANKSLKIAEIFKDEGFKIKKIRKDYAGLDRVLIVQSSV
ncbi:MAG: peptide chain release factor N(5)-glutamine methyltransferase [Elusimicrobia bacterium]|nr:peptide chain release factor N(5)-glutamine methyltransferase [Candidatus Liberimonas magnetica]